MRNHSLSRYLWLVLVVLASLTFLSTQDDAVCRTDGTLACGPDDLSHSVLVECDATTCSDADKIITENQSIDWPSNWPGEIIHVGTSRMGARLAQVHLENLDYSENDETRMLDINTTLYIDSRKNPDDGQQRKLLGFGATIDFSDLHEAIREDKFDRQFGPIFAALFGKTKHGARLGLLRLLVLPVENASIDLFEFLSRLDGELSKQAYKLDNKLKIIVDVHNRALPSPKFTGDNLAQPLANLDVLALADETGTTFGNHHLEGLGATPFRSVELDELSDLFDITISSLENTQGLLVRLKPSIPYEHLQGARNKVRPNVPILTIGRRFPKKASLGDWQTAQDSSIEIMNSLIHGSDGHIEDRSIADVLHDAKIDSDASLYSLHIDHGFHLRGPKFYTTAHYSRYLTPGCMQLKTELFTQPNMFAAHYSAFMSHDLKYIICVVSNENEHYLPLRLAIDRRIKTFVNLEPKSINTILINVAETNSGR